MYDLQHLGGKEYQSGRLNLISLLPTDPQSGILTHSESDYYPQPLQGGIEYS